MRIKGIIALLAIAVSCVRPSPAAPGIAGTLESAASSGKYLYAHQDDLPYGHSWVADIADPLGRSDVLDVCGDYPAIVGFDLGGIELGNDANLDGVPFDLMRAQAAAFVRAGGIVTFSWHLRNPLTGGDSWDVSSDGVVRSVLEGGERHGLFMEWLGRLADFLESIKDGEGNPIPCIFRPWHENTGSWFWWGENLCTDEDYRALWRMTYDFIAVERGLDNYLWAYSPSSTELAKAMDRYPGDDIIGLIGVDHYDSYGDDAVHDDFIRDMRRCLEYLSGVARQRGLLLAVTETGQESIPCPTWWTEVLQPSVKGFPVSYVLTWRNASDRPAHFFGPWKGASCEKDFLDFHDSDKTLFLKDLD